MATGPSGTGPGAPAYAGGRVTVLVLVTVVMLLAAGYLYYRDRTAIPVPSNVLKPGNDTGLAVVTEPGFSAFVALVGEQELTVMDFTRPMPLDPPPDGWWHRRFLTRRAMDLSFGSIGGEQALRLATDNSASMLFRFVEVPLDRYPLLAWRWLIEDPIESDRDELTRAGDDHPARLFISFLSAANERRALEIIWGNHLQAGDTKIIGNFPHYVANGGSGNLGEWQNEEVNLLSLYQRFWPDDEGAPVITRIGLFCDSDETGDDSIAWFSSVRLKQQVEGPGSNFSRFPGNLPISQ